MIFGEDTGTTDGDPTFAANSGIQFSASGQMLNFSDIPAYVFGEKFSISAWVKPNWTTAAQEGTILFKAGKDYKA